MTGSEFPADIWEAADEAVAAIVASGLAPTSTDGLLALKRLLALAILAERTRIQTEVIEAVASESDACQERVFRALRRGVVQ